MYEQIASNKRKSFLLVFFFLALIFLLVWVFEGMTGMSENVFINTKNRSHTITAEVTIPKGGAKGVILAQAGRFGGCCCWARAGNSVQHPRSTGLSQTLTGIYFFSSATPEADLVAVLATLEKSLKHKGITGFVVEKGMPGFSVG